MQQSSIAQSVYKLAIAGEQAGFSVECMIQMLNAGITVEALLDLIGWRLRDAVPEGRSSRWLCSRSSLPERSLASLRITLPIRRVRFLHRLPLFTCPHSPQSRFL